MADESEKAKNVVTTSEQWTPPVMKVIDILDQTMKVGISGPFDGGIKKS